MSRGRRFTGTRERLAPDSLDRHREHRIRELGRHTLRQILQSRISWVDQASETLLEDCRGDRISHPAIRRARCRDRPMTTTRFPALTSFAERRIDCGISRGGTQERGGGRHRIAPHYLCHPQATRVGPRNFSSRRRSDAPPVSTIFVETGVLYLARRVTIIMATQTLQASGAPDVDEAASATIAEGVRELGVLFRGVEGSALVFERVLADEPGHTQDLNDLAASIAAFLSRSAAEDTDVADFLVRSATDRLRIS